MITSPNDGGGLEHYRDPKLNDFLANLSSEQRASLEKRLELAEMLKREPDTYFQHVGQTSEGRDQFVIMRPGGECSGQFDLWSDKDGRVNFDRYRVDRWVTETPGLPKGEAGFKAPVRFYV